MKKIIYLLLLFFTFACTEKTTVISGKLMNFSDSTLSIYYYSDDSISVRNGEFKFTLDTIRGNYFTLNIGKGVDLFIQKGDQIQITYDCSTDSLSIIGASLLCNEYIQDIKNSFDSINSKVNELKLFDASYSDFSRTFDSLCSIIPEPSESMPSEFINYEKERVNAFRSGIYYRYPFSYALNHRLKYVRPEGFNSSTPIINTEDSLLLGLTEYRSLMMNYLDMSAKYNLANLPTEHADNMFTNEQIDVASDEINNRCIRNFALKSIMKNHLHDFGAFHAASLMERFRLACSDTQILREIENSYRNGLMKYENVLMEAYKTTKETTLQTHIFLPDSQNNKLCPAICIFFGGGWYIGTVEQLMGMARYFSKLGYVTLVFDYRTKGRFNTGPIEGIEDAKDAIRWTRMNAAKYHIDPNKITAFGHSAGGHVAASTATIIGFETNTKLSSIPNAVALSASCINPTVDDWFAYTLGTSKGIDKLSPVHQIRKGIPPFILFLGTKDQYIPVWTKKEFAEKMKTMGNVCELKLVEGVKHHAFLNNAGCDTIHAFLSRNGLN